MVWRIVLFVLCFCVGTFMCFMPSIEQKNNEKQKKSFEKFDEELNDILKKMLNKEQKKNA